MENNETSNKNNNENEEIKNENLEENNKNENDNNNNEIDKNNNFEEEKPEKKIPFLKDTNFDEIYSKINSIKQKHKEHFEENNSNNYFSLSNYHIDKIISNNNLKELFEMLEPKANFNYYNSPYNSNNKNYNLKLSNTFSMPINTAKISTYKNSNNPTISKIGNLFDDINIINQKKNIPQNNIYLRKSFVNNNKKKLNSFDDNFSKTMPNSILKNNNEKEKLKSGKKNLFNNNNFNNTFNNNNNLLKSSFKNWNSSFNNNNNNNNLWKSLNFSDSNEKNSYEKFTKNVISWFNKYNKQFYKEEINNLNDRLDKAGDYKLKNRNLKNKNIKSKIKYYYKK